jgi:hypothetical protein
MLKRKANTRNSLTSRTKLNIAGLASGFGKSGIIKNCISSTTSNEIFNFNLKKREIKIEKIKPKYYDDLPKFGILKDNVSVDQKNILVHFENFKYKEKTENYVFDNNTPYSIINLYQKDFDNGTVRLTKAGIYVLKENIIFNPNPDNDFFPKPSQMSKYPMGNSGPYHLGFFAAITVEADNIILNLNNKTLKQSELHNIEQRFYANIELSSSPFIPKQGPANFGSTIQFPNKVLVHNGTLALSSHHGIHGNKMENVVIYNVDFKDFEVAGIALNGTNNSIINNVNILGTSTNIKVLSTYSSARFIRKFLINIKAGSSSRSLSLSSGNKTIINIISELENLMATVKNAVENKTSIPINIFKNLSGLYDGNVYGIALNQTGILVHDFITTLGDKGNRNNHISNVNINNIISEPMEIVGISCPNPSTGAYGKGVQVGPVGDVLQISNSSNNNGTFKQNELINAKLIIGKYNSPKQGTTCVTNEVLNWAENGVTDIRAIASNFNRYFTFGQDSMAHTMKGNIGLFISSGENIDVKNVNINNIKSLGYKVGTDKFLTTIDKKGAISYGTVITGSNNIQLNIINIKNVISDSSDSVGLMIKSSTNINTEKISINKIITNDNSATTNIILQN